MSQSQGWRWSLMSDTAGSALGDRSVVGPRRTLAGTRASIAAAWRAAIETEGRPPAILPLAAGRHGERRRPLFRGRSRAEPAPLRRPHAGLRRACDAGARPAALARPARRAGGRVRRHDLGRLAIRAARRPGARSHPHRLRSGLYRGNGPSPRGRPLRPAWSPRRMGSTPTRRPTASASRPAARRMSRPAPSS